jgi:hypothetical protein
LLPLMLRRDKDSFQLFFLTFLEFHSCSWTCALSMLNVLLVEVFTLCFSLLSFLNFVVVCGRMFKAC